MFSVELRKKLEAEMRAELKTLSDLEPA